MKKIETQIRHLKKEIAEIDKNTIERKKHVEKMIEKTKNQISVLKHVKERYMILVDEFKSNRKKYDKLDVKMRKIQDDINSKIFYFTKVRSEIDFPKDIQERSDKIYRERFEMEKRGKELVEELRKSSIYINSKKIELLYEKKDIEKEFDFRLKKEKSMLSYYIKDLNNSEKGEEYDKKKRKIERLEKKLAKQKKQRSLANAYMKKSRLDASTVKSKLYENDICPYCGKKADELEADHIYPVSSGGLSINENMVNVCKTCNRNKGDLTLRQFIKRFDLDRDYVESRLGELGKRF